MVGNILIDHMILNEEKLTSKQVRDHTIAFMFAYEVYASGVSNMLLLLAMNTDVQQKCADEIMKVFPQNKTFDPDKINELPYLDMVTKEAFRLLPAIPLVLRQTLDDFKLTPELEVPKGVDFVINLFALHRRKDIWGEDADKFNPDNFLPENVAKRHSHSYLPFSGGQRNCLAYKYTMTLLKISLAKLLTAYQFTTTMKMKDIRIKSYVSMKLCTPHSVSIQKRIKS